MILTVTRRGDRCCDGQTSTFPRSHAGPLPTSLIKHMPLIASRRPRCTPWQCCRFFKRRAEGGALTVEAVKDLPRPAPAVGTVTAPRQEPDVRRKVWGPGKKRHGQRESRDVTLAIRRLLSRRPDGLKRGGERESGPAPKRQRFRCSNVCVFIQ